MSFGSCQHYSKVDAPSRIGEPAAESPNDDLTRKNIIVISRLIAMGRSKKQVFSTDQNRLADLAKALGHPARIAILEFLARSDACMCGDIVEELPLSQSTVSQHLRELKKVGLIKGDIEGTRVCYCIDKQALEHARNLMDKFLTSKCCC